MIAPLVAPPLLRRGDRVRVVAPGKYVAAERVETALRTFEAWGLRPETGTHLFAKHGSFAGTDEQRQEDLQAALDDEDVRAVVCARGGYGTTRFLDRLDWRAFRRSPKWLVGYSDATALLAAANREGYQALHATMPIMFDAPGDPAAGVESLRRLLFAGRDVVSFSAHPRNRPGAVTAPLVGGNLTMLANALGTPTAPETRGKILFLEDIGEYLYRIDRLVVQLRRAGCFDHLAGLVVGQFTDVLDNDGPDAFGGTAEALVAAAVADYDFPVAFGAPVGHVAETPALPVGGLATLKASGEGSQLQVATVPS